VANSVKPNNESVYSVTAVAGQRIFSHERSTPLSSIKLTVEFAPENSLGENFISQQDIELLEDIKKAVNDILEAISVKNIR
jgi:hypothetical protein